MAETKDLVDEFLQQSAASERRRLRRTRAVVVSVLVVVSALAVAALWLAVQTNRQRADLEVAATRDALRLLDLSTSEAATRRERDIAEEQKLEAERQQRITLARQLSAQAIMAVDRNLDIELSLLLAVEAVKLYQSLGLRPDVQADEALRRALGAAPQTILRYEQNRELDPASVDLSPLTSIEFSPSGKYLIVANLCDAVCVALRVVDVKTGVEVVTLNISSGENPISRFSPGEEKLAVVDSEGTVYVLHIPTGDIVTEVDTRMAAISSDATYLGIITSNGEARLLNMAESDSREVILPYAVETRFIAFDPPGQRLVTIDVQGNLHLWELASCKESLANYNDNGTDFSFATFSPDGAMLAAVGRDGSRGSGRFCLWDTHTGKQIASQRYEGKVECAVFSPSGQRVAEVEDTGFVHLWDVSKAAALGTYDGKLYNGCDESLDVEVFSPDDRRIMVDTGNAIAMLDTATGEEVAGFRREYGLEVVTFIKFVQDGSRLAMVSNEDVMRPGTLHLWDTENGNKISTMPHIGWIIDLEVSPEGSQIATISSSDPELIKPGPAYLWDTNTGELVSTFRHTHIGSISDLGFSRDGTKLASVGTDNTIRIWDRLKSREPIGMYYEATTAEELAELERSSIEVKVDANNVYLQQASGGQTMLSHEVSVKDYYLSRNHARIATVTSNSHVHVWNTADGELLANFPAASTMGGDNADADVDGIHFSTDGKRLAINVSWFYVSVWDIESNSEVAFFLQDEAALIDSLLNSDGTRLALLAGTGFIRRDVRTTTLWDVESSEKIAWVNGATLAEFSPDGTLLAAGGMDGMIHVLDAPNGEEVMILSHLGEIEALDFSSDGNLLATGGKDHTARLWDISTGVEAATLDHHADVTSVAFSPDGTKLFTHDSEGNAYKWLVDTDALATLACGILTRNFTQQEWQAYVGAEEPYRETCPDLAGSVRKQAP